MSISHRKSTSGTDTPIQGLWDSVYLQPYKEVVIDRPAQSGE